MPTLVENPEDRFTHDGAHVVMSGSEINANSEAEIIPCTVLPTH